jgi:hypothetical protein
MAHCFSLNPEGFIILSASTDMPPVIAYSLIGSFQVEGEQDNPLKDMVLTDLKMRHRYIDQFSSEEILYNNQCWANLIEGRKTGSGFQQWPPMGSSSTGGWLEISWNQTHPYNIFCPMDMVNGDRSLAGCPSVAMAMIMDYQKTLHSTRFDDGDDYYHSYAGRQYWIDDDHKVMDFLSFPLINEYFDSIESKYAGYGLLNEEERAALIFACGVAAEQVYTSGGSGTFGIHQAYDGYLRFGYDEAILIYDGDTSLFTRMKNNVKNGIPAHYAILSSTGQGGHNVVVDGYNTDNYYHVNFGWGGNYNAWYLLPEQLPYNLTLTEGVIVDIGTTHVGQHENPHNDAKLFIYPNPSSASVVLEWVCDRSMPQCIEVYNNLGRKIATLHSRSFPTSNQLSWQHNLPQGVYFIRLSSMGSVLTQKMVVTGINY